MREDGFYWVKRCGRWTVAEKKGDMWWLTGAELYFTEGNLQEVGERIERKS